MRRRRKASGARGTLGKLGKLGALLALAFAMWAYSQYRPRFADALELGSDQPPDRPAARAGDHRTNVRIATWNLRRLGAPDQYTDLEHLAQDLQKLDADLIAVQEIMDPQVLSQLRPQWVQRMSHGGGRGHQQLGFWWDPEALTLIGEPEEIDSLSMGGSVRPAYLAYFEPAGGQRFAAVVVHLKARPEGQDLRMRQWRELREQISKRVDPQLPLIVLGDFNLTGSADLPAASELQAIGEHFAALQLEAVPNPGGCSAYWQGPKRDAWLEASLLDLIWVRGFEAGPAWAGTHCGAHRCQRFRSTKAHPDLDYKEVSDHCPVIVDLQG